MRKYELMGKVIEVCAVYRRKTIGKQRTWERVQIEPRAGWWVGARTLLNGRLHTPKYPAYTEPGEYDEPYLTDTESVPCALVVFWPTENARHVPLDGFRTDTDLTPINDSEVAMRHWRKRYPREYDSWRTEMQQIMSDHPRDARGRWTK